MTTDKFRKLLKDNSEGGFFIHHHDVGGPSISSFLHLAGSGKVIACLNSRNIERDFADGGLVDKLNSESFWSLDDFSDDRVFDGSEYLIVFKNKKGEEKELHLLNPEFSGSDDIESLISLIESELFCLSNG